MAEQRELSGVLSRNEKREHDRQPAFKGSAMVDGVAYWLSAWVKTVDDRKFFSLSFTRKEQQPQAETRPQASPELKAKYGTNGDDRHDHRRGIRDEEVPF